MEKIEITPLAADGTRDASRRLKAQFNPATFSISRQVNWSPVQGVQAQQIDAPDLQFQGGGARVLSMELLFDATELSIEGHLPRLIRDVREKTNPLTALARIDNGQKTPPVLEIAWGDSGPEGSDLPFQGVITSLTQTFTLFDPDGTPLRAVIALALLERRQSAAEKRSSKLNAVLRIRRAADRLEGLAGQHLSDPSQWRSIAKVNNIEDPRKVPVGVLLTIPTRLS